MADESTPTQKTRPKKGDPVEIPVPSKPQIMSDFEKIVTVDDEDSDDGE